MARGQFNTEDELSQYYAKIYAELENSTLSDPYGSYILQRIKGGQKTVFNKTQSEIRNFDMSFLDAIESVYPAILKIMRDPKKSIRYDEEIVAVEKAKKVNSQTVRHLSSHTHLIKEIKGDDVIPSKVLTTFAEEELAIYENRFIKSLVKRIEMFLERRYDVMKVSLESFETEKLNVSNKFLMSGQEVTVSIDIAIKNDLTTNVETTKEQYNRLLYIREMIQGLKGTEFMRTLAKARDVLPPIMKTNIILHNPDFKLCYGLWLYLDRVDGIATNIDVKEKSYRYSNIFDKDMNECMALALTSFIKNRGIDGIYASKKLPQIKAPKPEENQEMQLDLNLDADNKKLEDYTMNELLLSQTAKFFEASMDGMQRTGNNYSESVRVVYRQMLDMLDQIYPMAFGTTDEELESKDLYEQLEFARRKMMIFKIVRQAKQMNIARMGKEEKRIEKLLGKLEDKIKIEEQKERERLEREKAKEEAKRLAEREKRMAEQARKKRLERDALNKQKAIERAKIEAAKRDQEVNEEKQREHEKMAKPIEAKRNYLKELKEQAAKQAQEQKNAMPIRRKDEYDDLSDDELEALMAANELIDDVPAEAEAASQEAPKVVKKKKKKPEEAPKQEEKKPEPKKEAPKPKQQDKDIEDMDFDELEALLGGMNDGFSAADLAGIDDEPKQEEQKPVATKKPKNKLTPPAPKPEPKEAPKVTKKPKEEPKEQAPIENNNLPVSEDFENMSDEELEALLAANELDDINPPLNDEPQVSEPEAAEPAQEPEAQETPQQDNQDDLEEMSDDELAALIAENGIEDLGDAPQEAPEQAQEEPEPEAEAAEPEQEPEAQDNDSTDDSSNDDFENMSDEELEALMKNNDMF